MSGPTAEQWTALNREVAETKAYAKAGKEDIEEIKKWIGEIRDDHETRLRRLERRITVLWAVLTTAWAGLATLAAWIKLGVLK